MVFYLEIREQKKKRNFQVYAKVYFSLYYFGCCFLFLIVKAIATIITTTITIATETRAMLVKFDALGEGVVVAVVAMLITETVPLPPFAT
jgi:hypothetical protein